MKSNMLLALELNTTDIFLSIIAAYGCSGNTDLRSSSDSLILLP